MVTKTLTKGLVLAVTTAVALPYTISVLCNILYGWPQTKNRYRRALHPKKVLQVNYAVLKKFGLLKYLRLMLKWKCFYAFSKPDRVIKDLCYGSNENLLDLYLPQSSSSSSGGDNLPVVIFVYGGTWSSGDKNMYGLLCNEISKNLNAIVCCPNYSIYPKGYVDDMIQDIVDCIEWIINNIGSYHGDKENIILIGHSAGAHLCVMSILELLTKQMLQGPPLPTTSIIESMRFIDRHFDSSNNSGSNNSDASNGEDEKKTVNNFGDSAASVSSFVVLNGRERTDDKTGFAAAAGEDGEGAGGAEVSISVQEGTPLAETATELGEEEPEQSLDISTDSYLMVSSNLGRAASSLGESSGSIELIRNSDEEETEKDGNVVDTERRDGPAKRRNDGDDDSKRDITTSYIRRPSAKLHEMKLTKSQQELYELFTAVRCVIGLAGVYHIGRHFEYETSRGVEDLSAMSRVMYGSEHFDRFSPTVIVENLPENAGLPPIVLVHPLCDKTVPYEQSTDLSQALSGSRQEIIVHLLPECNHYDVCLDLMDPDRAFYPVVMGIISQTAKRMLFATES
ncbi:uncharacterized protein LOC141904534 [Tubulanus polymorphus]|uniref:uncharacterized protein LOC141904534 n=1 Tax=Tubulanus polymorphus TaxID=672921 RepID=UPI003DA256C0